MHGGALLSFAPGFPATGLLAGSYSSGNPSVTLLIDKVEWFYQISGNNPMVRHYIQPATG